MTWPDFYLICFVVGFALSVISVLGSAFHIHLPHAHHGGNLAHGHMGQAFNMGTIAAFLAWFGGIGYLLSRFSTIWLGLTFILAALGGLIGATIVFWFLMKVLLANERPLEAIDFEMVGVFGRLSSAIREHGTGEISFVQGGARRSAAARSEDGGAIPKDAEVLVTHYDKGIATVRPWDSTDSKEII